MLPAPWLDGWAAGGLAVALSFLDAVDFAATWVFLTGAATGFSASSCFMDTWGAVDGAMVDAIVDAGAAAGAACVCMDVIAGMGVILDSDGRACR